MYFTKNNKLLIFTKIGIMVLGTTVYGILLFTRNMSFLTFILGIFIALLFSVIIHEGSHLMCAVGIGLRNLDLEISILKIKKDGNHFQFVLTNNGIYHGLCSCDYNSSINLGKYTLFCLAGGFANLLLCIASLTIIIISKSNPLRFHMFCQAITSLYDFCLNCLYMKSSDICLLKSIKNKKENK